MGCLPAAAMHFETVTLKLRSAPHRIRQGLSAIVACVGFGSALPLLAEVPEHPGAAIYAKLCIECHGKNGEGVKDKYDEPLHGNRSAEGLAKRIARTMPDDDVGACVGEDAKQVAAYIFDAFYSPKAQARLRPPGSISPASPSRSTARPWRILSAGFAPDSTNRPAPSVA